jgi:hypothetical protein
VSVGERLTSYKPFALDAIAPPTLLPDHPHATLACGFEQSPEEVALGYMNNLAFAHGMKPLFCGSFYVGTFGQYDMGAIRRADKL